MICVFKYVYYVYFVIIIQSRIFGHSYDMNSKKIKRFNAILNSKSWSTDGTNLNDNIAQQKLFVNGDLINVQDVLISLLNSDAENLLKISYVMYLAMGCKYSKAIKDIMNSLIVRLKDSEREFDEKMSLTKRDLKFVNIVILKSISTLFDLIDLAPNVISYESSILKSTILLNLNVNNFIEYLDYDNMDTENKKRLIDSSDRMIFQMINIMERFTISHCLLELNDINSNKRTRDLIRIFNNLLINTGLSISNFNKYNINSYLIVSELSNNESAQESSKQTPTTNESDDSFGKELSFKNDKDFNIIHHVFTEFRSILNNQDLFTDIKRISPGSKLDINYIFLVQKSIIDLIIIIIYQNLENMLVKLQETFLNSSQSREVNSTGNIENIFFGKTGMKDTQLLLTFERLLMKAKQNEFSLDLINSIELIVRILIDLPSRYKTIQGLNIIMKYINQNILILFKGKNIFFSEKANSLIKNYTSSNDENFELHTFLNKIVTIKYIKQFNQMYELLQKDFDENDEKVMNNRTFLNKIEFITDIGNNENKFVLIKPLYELSYKIKSNVVNVSLTKSNHNAIQTDIGTLINLMDEKIRELPNKNNSITLINYANDYLSFNVIKYPTIGNINEKLIRMVYHITNLLDKYQIHNFSSPKYRDAVFKELENNNQIYTSQTKTLSKRSLNEISTKFDKISFKNLVDKLPLPFFCNQYWKGEIKTMTQIYNDLFQNMFDISSIPKYIVLVLKWVSLVFSYKVIDVLYCARIESAGRSDSNRMVNTFKQFSSIDFRCSEISAIVLTMDSFKPDNKLPIESFEAQILFEENLEKLYHIFYPYSRRAIKLSSNIKKLENIVSDLKSNIK